MSAPVENRFEEYCDAIVDALSHADRHEPAKLYFEGTAVTWRKKERGANGSSTVSGDVRSAHQSMKPLVAAADWMTEPCSCRSEKVAPELLKKDERCWWIVDDTSHVKRVSTRWAWPGVLRTLG